MGEKEKRDSIYDVFMRHVGSSRQDKFVYEGINGIRKVLCIETYRQRKEGEGRERKR